MKHKAIMLNVGDDVATALTDLKAGDHLQVSLADRSYAVTLHDDIPFGHKFALHDIAQGNEILKYGMPILRALQPIPAGHWVHTHNGRSDRWGTQNEDLGVLPSVKDNLMRTERTERTEKT